MCNILWKSGGLQFTPTAQPSALQQQLSVPWIGTVLRQKAGGLWQCGTQTPLSILSREGLSMAQDTQWVVGAGKCVCTELQGLEEMWESSEVPPWRCAVQDHLEVLPTHTKPAGDAPEYWVFF